MTSGNPSTDHPADNERTMPVNARPLFMFGAARSGTTYLCRLLNAHPRVLLTNESAVVLQLGELIRRSHIGVSEGIVFGKSHNKIWSDVLLDESRRLIDLFYERVARHETGSRSDIEQLAFYGDKHPHLFLCFDLLDRLYPDARYIHLVRDPRDATLSIAKMSGESYQSALNNWKIFDDHNRAFVDTTNPGQVIGVKYEELVSDPQAVSERIFQSLGLEQDDQVVQFLDEYQAIDAHSILNSDGSGSSNPIQPQVQSATHQVGRWEHALSDADKELTDQLIGDTLTRYGYQRCVEC